MTIPVDAIKIDKSFTSGVTAKGPSRIITQGLVNIARRLGLIVIAEGVETWDQANSFIEFGCALAQGFLYSKAVPFAAATEMIRSKSAEASRLQRGASGPLIGAV
jgi:sensor c-di-GMP phosphodiesterase-like protein